MGTHYDKVKDDSSVIQHVNDELTCIINERNCQFSVFPAGKGMVIHPVDNTTAGDSEKGDEEVKRIRSKIEELTNKTEPKTLPITWMILQLEIQELRATHHKRYITYEEYLKIANERASLFDEEEIKASLTYFHFIGMLLYFQNSNLCDYVVVNLQWLYNNLAEVMHISSENVTFDDTKF